MKSKTKRILFEICLFLMKPDWVSSIIKSNVFLILTENIEATIL